MFKKIFGPKKYEAKGSPAAAAELRTALQGLFPQDGEVNQYLTFETNDKVHDGFAAVWEYFITETDEDNFNQHYWMTYTVFVDIRPDEKAVHLKAKRFARSKRPPKGTKVLDPWFIGIGIGDAVTIKEEYSKLFKSFNSKKKLELLAEKANSMGWDAYI